MSNGDKNPYERLFKLQAAVNKMVVDGKRRPEDVCAVLQAIVSESMVKQTENIISGFIVTVDYTKTLSEMIVAGRYDRPTKGVTTDLFSVNGSQQTVELMLVQFGRRFINDVVETKLDVCGLRSATLPELLAFGAQYPDKQRQFPIYALNGVWIDRYKWSCNVRWVVGLHGSSKERWLDVTCCDFPNEWGEDCRFLAVRKSQ